MVRQLKSQEPRRHGDAARCRGLFREKPIIDAQPIKIEANGPFVRNWSSTLPWLLAAQGAPPPPLKGLVAKPLTKLSFGDATLARD